MNGSWLVFGASFLMAFSTCADATEVFRWKDREGRINYGNMPPPGVKAEPVDGRGLLTVVPAPVLPPAPPPPPPEERLERLERELETERQLRLDAEAAARERESARAASKAECEALHREACDDDGQPVGRRYILVPQRPFPHLPGVPPARPPHRDPPRDRGRVPDGGGGDRASRRNPRGDNAGTVPSRTQGGTSRPDEQRTRLP